MIIRSDKLNFGTKGIIRNFCQLVIRNSLKFSSDEENGLKEYRNKEDK